MTGETSTPGFDVRAPSTPATTRTCPKCRRDCPASEPACARCGLLAARFARYSLGADPPELDDAWRECTGSWSTVALHDRALDLATQFACLPSLARRYRERLLSGADPIAERRLQQITVLIETATRAQAKEGRSSGATRAVWLLGYLVTALVLAASTWVFVIALRGHR